MLRFTFIVLCSFLGLGKCFYFPVNDSEMSVINDCLQWAELSLASKTMIQEDMKDLIKQDCKIFLTAGPCFARSLSNLYSTINAQDLLEFACSNDGERLVSLHENDGFSCIKSNINKIIPCFNDFKNLRRNTEKKCEFNELNKCLFNNIQTCNTTAAAEFISSMMSVAKCRERFVVNKVVFLYVALIILFVIIAQHIIVISIRLLNLGAGHNKKTLITVANAA